MVSRMRRPRVAFDMNIDDGPLHPGAEVRVDLTLHPREKAEVRQGHVEITCIQTYWQQVQRYVYSRFGGYYRTSLYRYTEVLFKDSKTFVEATQLMTEMPVRKRISFVLPDGAPPTVRGGAVNIQWGIAASVDVAKKRDLHLNADLMVSMRQPPASSGAGLDPMARAEATFEQGTMSLTVPSEPVRAGDTITGTLQLNTRQSLSLRQVRVELERREVAGHRGWSGLMDQQVLEESPDLGAGQVREWRYRLQVPAGPWPTIQTARSGLEWRVRAVLDRRAKGDPVVEAAVGVHTGPDRV